MTGDELDEFARDELRTLPKDLATRVARHLVMAGRLVDEDSTAAYDHARAARRLASRVGVVREACGFAAYHTGEWADALAELRAARRLAGREDAYLAIMADCERGLGRPERALDIAKSADVKKLEHEERIELRMVESGARRDLGQYDAAVVALQIPELKDRRLRPWSARLFYAYADALLDAGREDDARDWFARAAAADRDGETDAAERHADLEGLEIIDAELIEPEAGQIEEQGTEKAGTEAPGTEALGVEESGVEESGQDSGVEESVADEPAADESGVEVSTIEESGTGDSGVDEPAGEEPVIEDLQRMPTFKAPEPVEPSATAGKPEAAQPHRIETGIFQAEVTEAAAEAPVDKPEGVEADVTDKNPKAPGPSA